MRVLTAICALSAILLAPPRASADDEKPNCVRLSAGLAQYTTAPDGSHAGHLTLAVLEADYQYWPLEQLGLSAGLQVGLLESGAAVGVTFLPLGWHSSGLSLSLDAATGIKIVASYTLPNYVLLEPGLGLHINSDGVTSYDITARAIVGEELADDNTWHPVRGFLGPMVSWEVHF